LPDLIILGSAASVPDAGHDTIALALRGAGEVVLIDCGGSPLHKLARLGIAPGDIRAVVLTHCHADHLYGLPILVQGLWLGGREASLPIYGPKEAIDVGRKLLELLDLTTAEEELPVEWHSIPLREGQQVFKVGEVQITAAPVIHGSRDTIALRFDNVATGRSIVYSADTEPCPALVRLAAGAEMLIHEATGEHSGHSSPAQAAEVARAAGAARLALIHYPVRGVSLDAWRQAAAKFPGPVTLAQDGDVYPF
jgi:ribonuclease Z